MQFAVKRVVEEIATVKLNGLWNSLAPRFLAWKDCFVGVFNTFTLSILNQATRSLQLFAFSLEKQRVYDGVLDDFLCVAYVYLDPIQKGFFNHEPHEQTRKFFIGLLL